MRLIRERRRQLPPRRFLVEPRDMVWVWPLVGIGMSVRCFGAHPNPNGADAVMPLGLWGWVFAASVVMFLVGIAANHRSPYLLGLYTIRVAMTFWVVAMFTASIKADDPWSFYWTWPLLGVFAARASIRRLRVVYRSRGGTDDGLA